MVAPTAGVEWTSSQVTADWDAAAAPVAETDLSTVVAAPGWDPASAPAATGWD